MFNLWPNYISIFRYNIEDSNALLHTSVTTLSRCNTETQYTFASFAIIWTEE
jgi:hypothetical protein